MKKLHYLVIGVTLLLQGCVQPIDFKDETNNTIKIEDFNWEITIPRGFQKVNSEEWAKKQEKQAGDLKDSYGNQLEIKTESIFLYQSDQVNYMEASRQPYDTTTNIDFATSFRKITDVLYVVYQEQMPTTEIIDTTRGVERIDDLEFETFHMKLKFPDKNILNVTVYSRVFGAERLTMNIMFVDLKKGVQLLEAWNNSKFK